MKQERSRAWLLVDHSHAQFDLRMYRRVYERLHMLNDKAFSLIQSLGQISEVDIPIRVRASYSLIEV